MRDTNKFHFLFNFSKLFMYNYCFLYHGDQKISQWRICRWRAVNFEIHLCGSGVHSDQGECFFWGLCKPLASPWSHQLTSDPKRCLLFWKCLQWSCLKAVSVPTFIIGGLWGSAATSAVVFTENAHQRCSKIEPLVLWEKKWNINFLHWLGDPGQKQK